jgi:hypothetical protein
MRFPRKNKFKDDEDEESKSSDDEKFVYIKASSTE